ncbi:MAG: DUF523 domain-containing protein [Clostridia bacterium]|nr:DUF523 domain-containing protein [Clostridia bacterium]
MRILVSACLLGVCCRYDGSGRPCRAVMDLGKEHELVPVCPEQLGGLPTPRPPAEIQGERVVTCEGRDVTAEYCKGAEEAARLCRMLRCGRAILKARSPSCGSEQVYDGSFSGRLVSGDGMTARKLKAMGVPVTTEESLDPG